MGGILSSLNTGYTGLQAHQLMVDVTSNNISNASDEFYTRQRVLVRPQSPILKHENVSFGRGVNVDSVQRLHDEFVFSRYTKAATDYNYFDTEFDTLREVGSYLPDIQGVGVYNDLEQYFNSWKDIAKNPNDVSQKQVLAKNVDILTRSLNDVKNKLLTLQRKSSDELASQVKDANRIGQQIANINQKIGELEENHMLKQANELRDVRDELEFRLQEILGGNVFKNNISGNNLASPKVADFDDSYVFNIGHGFNMIEGTMFHPIVISNDNHQGLHRVYIRGYDFKDFDITDKMDQGKVGALLDLYNTGYDGTRVGKLQRYMNLLDSFARGLIEATNTIYAQSATGSIIGDSLELTDKDALKDTNYNVNQGKFTLYVYATDGSVLSQKDVFIGASTTMRDIVNQINYNSDDNRDNNSQNDFDDYFTAYFDNNTRVFMIKPKYQSRGMFVGLQDHGTNFTGAFGINRFFSGNDATTIALSREYRDDPTKIRPWLMPSNGNFDVANMMQQLQFDDVEFYQNKLDKQHMRLNEYYQYVVGAVANNGEEVKTMLDTKRAVLEAAKKEHLSISQVSIDEEMVNLIKFQGGYAANAKVITTIDRMIDTLLTIKQ